MLQSSLFQLSLFQSSLFQSVLFQLYVGGGAIALCVYLALWMRDRTTPMTDPGSWLVLLLASCFWPIVLPISVITELLPRWRAGRSR